MLASKKIDAFHNFHIQKLDNCLFKKNENLSAVTKLVYNVWKSFKYEGNESWLIYKLWGVNPTKLFSSLTHTISVFLLLSLAILKQIHFFSFPSNTQSLATEI